MADMLTLISSLHSRSMRIILDLVINHTSSQHPWFLSSSASRSSPHADWYIWKDPIFTLDPTTNQKTRSPPNNWGANFGGSAWTYVPARKQYYLHLFAPEQPDLNWECEAARKAIYETAVQFWFDKGVDGFRVDTANLYSKVQTFPDGVPVKGNRMYPLAEAGPFVANGPRIHEFWREVRGKMEGDPFMVGEIGGCSKKQILEYIGSDRGELGMLFDFDFVACGEMFRRPWHEIHGRGYTLPEMKRALGKTQELVMDPKGWSSMFAENHDLPRSVSRFGDTGVYWEKSCKLLAMMLGLLSGTLFLYQGQEIGMTNIPETWSMEDIKDVASIKYYEKVQADHPGDGEILKRAWKGIVGYSRDNARTPMQWTATAHAGFSSTQPWMRVNDNYTAINVASQLRVNDSVLDFWQRIIFFRKSYADLWIHGSYRVHDIENPHTFVFEKISVTGSKALVLLNFSGEEQEFEIPDGYEGKSMRCVISNEDRPAGRLGPWEGRGYMEEVEHEKN
jgi:oligo-1,6-glucosidase